MRQSLYISFIKNYIVRGYVFWNKMCYAILSSPHDSEVCIAQSQHCRARSQFTTLTTQQKILKEINVKNNISWVYHVLYTIYTVYSRITWHENGRWNLDSAPRFVFAEKIEKIVCKVRSQSDSAVSMGPRKPNFAKDYLDFLGEKEAICKTALGHESGA
jgi:hypothetical protein